MQSFLDVVLPPFLLAAFGLFVCAVTTVAAVARMRLWAARRSRITGVRAALSGARDALAAVISDPGIGADARDRAVTAYEAAVTALTKENDHQ